MKKSGTIFFTIAYLALAIPMFCLPDQGFFIGSFGVEYRYLLAIGIIMLSVLHFLISGDLRRAIRCVQDAMVMAKPYLWPLAYSLVLWVVTMAGFRVMTKGTFLVVYQLIAIFAAAGTLYMFGSRGVYLQIFAMTASLAMMALYQITQVGLGEFLRQYFENIITFTSSSGKAMRYFETQGHIYATGFSFVYFILTRKEKRVNSIMVAICFLLLFLGLKRSVFLGVCIGLVFGFLVVRIKNPAKWVTPVSIMAIILVLGYILLISSGLFDYLESIGIPTSGRSWLYNRLSEFYRMSPTYFGRGLGFVATSFSNGVFDISEYGFQIGNMHNEYLRQYIDCGFWGFLIWLWLYIGGQTHHFFHKAADEEEKRHGIITFVLVMVSCVLFMTEDTFFYFYSTITLAILILGYHHETFVERTKLPGEET